MDRDAEIAVMIRRLIDKERNQIEKCGYERGSPNDAYSQGRIVGLRMALALVDLNPYNA